MYLNDVGLYAPEGYRLGRSDYERGVCRHVFMAAGQPDLTCEGAWEDAAQERAALVAFRAAHVKGKLETLRAALAEGEASPVAEGYSVERVIEKVNALAPTLPPPAKGKGKTK